MTKQEEIEGLVEKYISLAYWYEGQKNVVKSLTKGLIKKLSAKGVIQMTTDKIYPEVLYYGKRVSQSGHQPVYKKLLPDGEPTELSPDASLKLCDHSYEFNWGYGGSGPAQLSLALLLDATTVPDTALAYYQEFKQDKVAWWKQEWSTSRSEILLWIFEKQKEQLEAMVSRN